MMHTNGVLPNCVKGPFNDIHRPHMLCAAILNAHETGCNRVFLTSLGGGAFGNPTHWITDAITRALNLSGDRRLDVNFLSYGQTTYEIKAIESDLSAGWYSS